MTMQLLSALLYVGKIAQELLADIEPTCLSLILDDSTVEPVIQFVGKWLGNI